MKDEGWSEVRGGTLDKEQTQDDMAVSGSFLSDAMGILKDNSVSADVQDQVYQLYLETLPELSQRKHFIHRKKTAGFSQNALQAFSHTMLHQAHQIAKMQHRGKLQDELKELKEDVQAARQEDAALAGNILKELKERHNWVMTPTNEGWTNLTSSLGFVWFLGVSPAAALVNTTQTAIIAFPVMASKFGWGKAGKALLGAAKLMNARETALGEGSLDRSLLEDDEKAAFDRWLEMGVLDRSMAHNLAGIGDSDKVTSSPEYQKRMGQVSHLFHKAEVINREVTLLAAYRLARDEGKMNPSDAIQYASDATWEAHFDYSNANRARFMQSDMAKLFLMFRSYSQHALYYLIRNGIQATKKRGKSCWVHWV